MKLLNKALILLVLCAMAWFAAGALCGCISYTCPSDRAVIHDGMLNAVDITDKVLADPNASPAAKRWFVAERTQWIGLDAWAHTRKWPASQPAGGGQ